MKFQHIISSTVLLFSLNANAAIITSITDDFEGDLSQWTGKNDGSTGGYLTADPLDSSNQVLSFNRVIGAGDIFTIDTVSTTSTYTVSFDYLGNCGTSDCGGYFGISVGLPGNHYWVAGTGSYSTPISLIDDGTWHSYDLTFTNYFGATPVHFMLEDWNGSLDGSANNVFFDNFSFYDTNLPPVVVPEPSIIALMGLGLIGMGLSRRKMKK